MVRVIPRADAVGLLYSAPDGAETRDGYYVEPAFLTANRPLPTANCPLSLSDSFAVYSAQGCQESALFDLGGAGAGEALLIYRGGCVDLYGLQVADGSACERAVERALKRVPGKLERRAHVFIIDKDTPAAIVHPYEVNLRRLR